MATNPTTPTTQPFPNVTAPIANPDFTVTSAWRQFFLTLWNRTGGGTGGGGFVPTGTLGPFAGASTVLPNGWLLCDGSAVSRTTYSNLFSTIGTVWGAGDGNTTFNVPDGRGRMLIGAGGSFALAQLGGASDVTLTVGQLPSHTHGVNDPGHSHNINDPGHVHASVVAASTNTAGAAVGSQTAGNTASATTGITVVSAGTNITIQSTGSGNPIHTISPYATINWIIKT